MHEKLIRLTNDVKKVKTEIYDKCKQMINKIMKIKKNERFHFEMLFANVFDARKLYEFSRQKRG